ncbi:MAG TPA: ROK family protein, partial [Spirochaetota bacterium]|nr:ROK family protein [Spirochaetota bacterium]
IKFSNIDINMIVSHIADYVQKINKTILGISIGLPGVVDPVTGIIINSRYLQLANYPLKKKLQCEFKCPILINNNANLAAFAEYYNVAQQKNIKNILFLYIQELFVNNVTHIGFGLGIIINGQIYHGEHLQAGEFNKAINFYKNKLIDNNETAALLQKKDMDRLQQNSLPELFQKSQNGDKAAALFIDKLFSILSELISMAISIIDPGITFIGYDSNQKLDPLFLNHLREFLLKRSLNVTSKLPGIEASELNGRSVMIGAANKMLDTLFQVPELKNSLLYSNI